jgi:hypothetical protein
LPCPAAYLRRNVRPLDEAQGVLGRIAAPLLAVVASLAAVVGAGDLASLVLLAAIVAAAVRLLETVGAVAEDRSDRFCVLISAVALACLVAAGATHVPLVALGVLACLGLEVLGDPGVAVRPELAGEAAELADAPVSRAA